MNKMDKKVLAVPTDKFFPGGIWEEFRFFPDRNEIFGVIKNFGVYLRRGDLEENENYQQVIVQIVLLANDKIFIHQIAQTGSESRLHNLFPIFLGGHVDDGESFEDSVDREFKEEINYNGSIISKEFQGVVKLHKNPVDRVHVGLVWVFQGNTEDFTDTEDDGVVNGKFMTWAEAAELKDQMSHWSKVSFDQLREKFEVK